MDRPITRVNENLSPLDSDYILGASKDSNLFQKTRVIDLITSRYNPNSGWQIVDGSGGNYNANPNDRIFTPDSGIAYDVLLDDVFAFGDTITIYSKIEGVNLKYDGTTIKSATKNNVIHLLFDGSVWLDFSGVTAGSLSDFPKVAKVIATTYPRIIPGIFINDFIGVGKVWP